MAKAEVRMTLAQLLSHDPRTPWEVVLDATHTADALMRDTKAKVLAGGDVTVEQVDRLLELTTYAHRLAAVAIQTRAAERVQQTHERNLNQHVGLLVDVVTAIIDGIERYLTGLGLDARQVVELREWAFEAVAVQAEAAGHEAAPELPPLPPVPQEAVRVVEHDAGDDHARRPRVRDEDDQHDQHGIASHVSGGDDPDDHHDHERDDDHDDDPPDALPAEVLSRPGVAELVMFPRKRDEPG